MTGSPLNKIFWCYVDGGNANFQNKSYAVNGGAVAGNRIVRPLHSKLIIKLAELQEHGNQFVDIGGRIVFGWL